MAGFLGHAARLGFNSAFYGLSFSEHNNQLPGIYLSNYQNDFLEQYDKLSDNHNETNDTAVKWCLENDETLQWGSQQHIALTTPSSVPVEQLAMDFGMHYGVSIPIRSRSHLYIGGIGICAQGVSHKTYHHEIAINIPLIEKFTHIFHAHLNALDNGTLFMTAAHTSIKQVNALELKTMKLLASGLTIKEIADNKLYKSVEIVNLYIKSSKVKLQVKTRNQLIARAIVLGIIYSIALSLTPVVITLLLSTVIVIGQMILTVKYSTKEKEQADAMTK